MKTKTTYFFAVLILSISVFYASGQDTASYHKKGLSRKWINEKGGYISLFSGGVNYLDFNYFMGDDNENFKTTLKGLGSIGNSHEISIVTAGNRHIAMFLNLGYSIRYYRFEKNLMLTKSDNSVEDQIVENQPYAFKNKFFSWSKNKMVLGYLVIPVGFDIKTKFADLRIQASYLRYLSGKHKLKYNIIDDGVFENKGDVTIGWLAGDDRQKFKTPNAEFKDYFLNKNNFSVQIMLIPDISGDKNTGIGFRYDLKPLFIEDKGPDIHEVSVFISSGN
ncbi:MAG: hypothetical protein JW723_15095 [Bacteroidales bacterium]|nr:hypothetical protein [Bacteroidales bacterium]